MTERQPLPAAPLDDAGLNRQFVFDIAALPAPLTASLAPQPAERQLLLVGHAGRRLWAQVQASGQGGSHPIDDYTVATLTRWLAEHLPGRHYRMLYPGDTHIGLQALGQLAGWHQPSPLMVGVDPEWGSWFAYRAAILIDADFSPSRVVDRSKPCTHCRARPCTSACPAMALDSGDFDFERCSRYRLLENSRCALGCAARLACPVGAEHQYEPAQIAHSYALSLAAIRRHYATEAESKPAA